ncbi:arginase family protein [Cellulomonas cellasea]|uniref:Arginase n=1 Tax=Cellulomonas cellasea TaxID=43670 RepID=A0A7W4UDG1_9CELL|nr:arginase family protein [Cellulomonas cellasea]MBB2922022.1 arginase [Cellulomonas cellasea]
MSTDTPGTDPTPSPTTAAAGRRWGLLGVPTSAAAHGPGLEKAPAALRGAGLVEALTDAGLAVSDHGDRPTARWRSARSPGRPNDVDGAVVVLRDAVPAIEAVLAAGELPLVVGGDCTLAVALVDAAVRTFGDVGLVYVDGGQDLMIPTEHPDEPILDGMGVAHLLDLPGTVDELAGLGVRRPLLSAEHVCFVGYADEEEDTHGRVPSLRLPADVVTADPVGSARRAAGAVLRGRERFVVHVDVDVLDFFGLPAADVPSFGRGLTAPTLAAALAALVAEPGFAGLTFVEHNPDHGAADGSTTRALVDLLRQALAPR